MFRGNQDDYTTASMCLDLLSMGYLQIARDNAGLTKDNKTKKNNSETTIKEKESLVGTEADSKGLESKTTYKKFENVIEADKELSKQYSDWEKSLTKEEREAFQAYTETKENYKNINRVLRGKESNYIGNNEQYVQNIEGALNRAEVPEDIITYRGTTPSALGEIMDLSPEDMVGNILHDDAFVSTSVNPLVVEYGYSEKGVTLIIETPKGTPGAYIAPVSTIGLGEAELLLNKGQDMLILEVVDPNKNHLVLRVQIVQ